MGLLRSIRLSKIYCIDKLLKDDRGGLCLISIDNDLNRAEFLTGEQFFC